MAVSFLKRGKEAQRAIEQDEAAAEVRAAQNKARRFWVPKGKENAVTFLDGKLTPEGILSTTTFWEHRLNLNGHWRNYFPCTADSEPCPLCEVDSPRTLVSLFTVIDHSKFVDRNGNKRKNERKLFVAKRDTLKLLQKMASKRGGLAGWQVSISRFGERSPEVGTVFDFLDRVPLKEIAQTYKIKPEEAVPFDYDEVVRSYTADELREMGFGSHVVGQHDARRLRKGPATAAAHDDDDDDDDVPQKSRRRAVVDEDDDDDVPAKSRRRAVVDDDEDDDVPVRAKKKAAVAHEDDDEDDDIPSGAHPADDDDDDDDDDAPPVRGRKAKTAVVDEDDETPPKVRRLKLGGKKKAAAVVEDDDGSSAEDDDNGM